MNLRFLYEPNREVTALKFGLKSTNSTEQTDFARRAIETGIDTQNIEVVGQLAATILSESNIGPDKLADHYQKQWLQIEKEAAHRLRRMFATDWDPGAVTAYLTVSTRCPYNVKERYFFVSCFKSSPVRTCLHELQHFYAHQLLEPIFVERGMPERFNEFKESLTVLLNETCVDLIEEPDQGYPQHAEARQRILELWRKQKSLQEIAQAW